MGIVDKWSLGAGTTLVACEFVVVNVRLDVQYLTRRERGEDHRIGHEG
jgi:hypothetical protein